MAPRTARNAARGGLLLRPQGQKRATWRLRSPGAVATPELLCPRRSACPLFTDSETEVLAEKVNFSPNKRRCSNAPAKPQIPGGLELTFTQDTKSGVQSHQVFTNLRGTDGNVQCPRQIRIRGGEILPGGSAELAPLALSVRQTAGPRGNPASLLHQQQSFTSEDLDVSFLTRGRGVERGAAAGPASDSEAGGEAPTQVGSPRRDSHLLPQLRGPGTPAEDTPGRGDTSPGRHGGCCQDQHPLWWGVRVRTPLRRTPSS